MAKQETHYFKFYYDKFLSGTRDMTAEETGAYLLLLCHQWDKGYVPLDLEEQQIISKTNGEILKKVLKKFKEKKIGLINEVMARQKREYVKYCKDQAQRGKTKKQRLKQVLSVGLPNDEPTGGYNNTVNNSIEQHNTTKAAVVENSKIINQFLEDQHWKEIACKTLQIGMSECEREMNLFLNHCRMTDDINKPLKELRTHFRNWKLNRISKITTPVSSDYKIKHDVDN